MLNAVLGAERLNDQAVIQQSAFSNQHF